MTRTRKAVPSLLRAVAGLGLLLLGRPSWVWRQPFVGELLQWMPARSAFFWLGVVTLVVAAGELVLLAAGLRDQLPRRPRGRARAGRWGLVGDVLAAGLLAAGGIKLQLAWLALANPEHVLSGPDYNVYALNTLAVRTGAWDLYNPDKHALHARVVAALAGGADPRETLVHLSAVCIGLFPALAYVLGRRVGGGYVGLVAAAIAVAAPLPWAFTGQTTCYPFYFVLIVAACAALLAFVQRPALGSALVLGLVAGLATATQEKAVITLLPVAGLLVLVGLPAAVVAGVRLPATLRFGALAALAVGLAAGVNQLSAPPRPYTPLVSLVTNQREEMHRELPWTWSEVKQPDVQDPAGLRRWLPAAWRDGEIESWVASLRTPPDANSLRLARDRQGGVWPWSVAADTSIAPTEVRWKAGVATLPKFVPSLREQGLALAAIGLCGLLLGTRRQRLGFALAGAIVAAIPPLTLKVWSHYFPHLAPILAVLAVGGLDALTRRLLPGRWAWLGRAALLPLWGSVFLALWTGNLQAWREAPWAGRPRAARAATLAFPPPAVHAPDDPGSYARGLKEVGAWLRASTHTGPIVDCLPGSLLLALPGDPRVKSAAGESACRSASAAPAVGDWLVASNHMEYRGPNHPDPDRLVGTGAWRFVWGWHERSGGFTETFGQFPASAVVVLEATGSGKAAP